MPILIDYSQLAISCATVFPDDMQKGKPTDKMQDIIRHVTLKSIITYNRDYKKRFGELILCCDSSPSWRREVFPYYKAHRAKNREESPIDWDTVRKFIDELKHDIETVFHYPIVAAPNAEGDDCIGAICKYLQTEQSHDTSDNPLDALSGETPDILIVSSDHDFKQCHKYKKVKQWSPMQKKWVKVDEPDFLVDKIIGGDKGDGIPSVLMPDDFLVNGTGRATPVTASVRAKYKQYDTLTEDEKKRYDRNRLLIDFDAMPDRIYDGVVKSYNQERRKRNRSDIFNYLVKHRCRELIDRLEDF